MIQFDGSHIFQMGEKKPPTRIDWSIGIDYTVPTKYVEGGAKEFCPRGSMKYQSPPRVFTCAFLYLCLSTTLLRNQKSTTGPEKIHCQNPQKLFLQEKQSTTGHWSRKNPLPKSLRNYFSRKNPLPKILRKGFLYHPWFFLVAKISPSSNETWGRNGPWALQRRLVLIPSSPNKRPYPPEV